MLRLLAMERFVTSTRVDPSGASSSNRKTPDNAWLEQFELIENLGRNGMCVKCVHCKLVLKASTTRLILDPSDTSDSSDSD